jgi:hypothetical protein
MTAIALPRVPEHFHSCSHAAIACWRFPVDRTSWVIKPSLHLKIAPPCASGRGIHLYVKGCGSVPRGKTLSAGGYLGVRDAMP